VLPNGGYQIGGLALSSELKIGGINSSDFADSNPVPTKIALSDA